MKILFQAIGGIQTRMFSVFYKQDLILKQMQIMVMKINLIIILYFFSNTVFSQSNDLKIRCIEAVKVFPDFNLNGDVTKYDTSIIKVYFYGRKRMYDLLYHFTQTKNEIITISEIRHHFTAFDIDSSYGYDLNMTSGIIKRVKLDSLFKNEWIVKNRLYPFSNNTISLLKESIRNIDSRTLVEHFLIKNKTDSSNLGECTFSYSDKFSDIDISFSKELDSIKQIKLYKVESLSYPRFYKENNFKVGRFITSYTLKEGSILDEKNILSYFIMLNAN